VLHLLDRVEKCLLADGELHTQIVAPPFSGFGL